MHNNPGFVFVHGAWHSGACWNKVIGLLQDEGFACAAIDLPGAGANAAAPASLQARDMAALATEPSPNAGVGQEERTNAVINSVEQMAERSNGKVVLVGHSMGGVTISPVAEAIPSALEAVVFLTAFMLPPGMPAIAMIQDPAMADAVVPSLFVADPQVVGALRIDTLSDDPDDRARLREAFYADLDEEAFTEAVAQLHSDEPAQVAVNPSAATVERFGSVARHYVRCHHDRAITPAGQEKMIALTDAALGGKTTVHELHASHSPFHSQPEELVAILRKIAVAPR